MIDKDLLKHAREFKGYLDNHQYDVTDEGILFPKAGAISSGNISSTPTASDPTRRTTCILCKG